MTTNVSFDERKFVFSEDGSEVSCELKCRLKTKNVTGLYVLICSEFKPLFNMLEKKNCVLDGTDILFTVKATSRKRAEDEMNPVIGKHFAEDKGQLHAMNIAHNIMTWVRSYIRFNIEEEMSVYHRALTIAKTNMTKHIQEMKNSN